MVTLRMTPNCPKPPHFLHFAPPFIASQRVNLETSNLVHWFTITSPTLPMKNLPWKGRGQGHVSNFYIVDLENFATASCRYISNIYNSPVVGLFMTPIGQWKRLDRVTVECTCLLHSDPLSPSNLITSIRSGLVVQVVSALLHGNWQDFNWRDASRGPSAIAELLVHIYYSVWSTVNKHISEKLKSCWLNVLGHLPELYSNTTYTVSQLKWG